MMWRPQFQNPGNINNMKNPQSNESNRPSTRGGFAHRERGRGRGPPKLTNHNPRDPYYITEEVIAPKGAQKPRTLLEFSK
jgi:hypothetical protein